MKKQEAQENSTVGRALDSHGVQSLTSHMLPNCARSDSEHRARNKPGALLGMAQTQKERNDPGKIQSSCKSLIF